MTSPILKKWRKLAVLGAMTLILSLSFSPLVGAAETELENHPSGDEEEVEVPLIEVELPDEESETEAALENQAEEQRNVQVLRTAFLLLKLKERLVRATENYQAIQAEIEETKTKLLETREMSKTLEGQIKNLDNQINETGDKILNVEKQKISKEMEIKNLMEKIKFKEIELKSQKEVVKDFVRLLYFQKNRYFGVKNKLNPLKLFLEEETVSTSLQKLTYLSIVEQTGEEIFERLDQIKTDLQSKNEELEKKRDQLKLLTQKLSEEKNNLEAQKEGKENLLKETEGKEEVYQGLLAQVRTQEEAILEEINNFQENIGLLEEKIETVRQVIGPEDYEEIIKIKAEALYQTGVQEAAEFLSLAWPVSPELGLTAYFDDSGYLKVFGVPHHALDIRTPQETPISAPADGLVYKIVDNDTGYNYLILAHRKGIMTVYGHLTAVAAQEGDYVKRGQIIALSGGVPGTRGAGLRTTGAHLHFEVIQDGIRVDPLDYLSLAEVPLDYLSEKYLKRLQEQLEKALEEEF